MSQTRRVLSLLCLLLGLPGCHARWNPLGSPPPYHFRADRDPEAPGELEGRAMELEQELSRLGVSAQNPRCERACALVGEICAVSVKLCEISARHPGDAHYRDFCDSGEKRCQRGRADVSPACACQRSGP